MITLFIASGFVCIWLLICAWLINRSEEKIKDQFERINEENKAIANLISTMLAEERGKEGNNENQ